MLPNIVIDTTALGRLVNAHGQPTAVERVTIVQLIDVVYSAIDRSVENGVPKQEIFLWADTELGEGALFRSITDELHTLVRVDLDNSDSQSRILDRIKDLTTRYRPWALAVRVSTTARELNEAEDISNKLSLYVFLHETLAAATVPLVWDLRNNTDPSLNSTLRAENDVQIMTTFQDAGLDPSGWILTHPGNRATTAILTGRAHIDDRNDVAVCFCPNVETVSLPSEQNPEPSQIEPSLKQALVDASRMPGNIRIALGLGSFKPPLTMLIENRLSAEEASNAIASQIKEAAKIIVGTQVSA